MVERMTLQWFCRLLLWMVLAGWQILEGFGLQNTYGAAIIGFTLFVSLSFLSHVSDSFPNHGPSCFLGFPFR